MVILLVFHTGDTGSIPLEGNIFFVFNLIFSSFYIICNKSLVAFYIEFNALAKSSHQPLFFFLIFKSKPHCHSYGYRYAVMSFFF